MATAAPALVAAQAAPPTSRRWPSCKSNKAKRLHYLATARIWTDPGDSPQTALLAGPPLADGSGVDAALNGRPFPCTFAQPGKDMGGATLKFTCTTARARSIRVKYTEPSKTSNREVFATVAASRLLWALGFTSHPVYPIALDCLNCPDDPTEGTGKKAKRSYLATYSPIFTDPALVDEDEADQGWQWAELDTAVKALPDGELRSRQLQHYEALDARRCPSSARRPEAGTAAACLPQRAQPGAGSARPWRGKTTRWPGSLSSSRIPVRPPATRQPSPCKTWVRPSAVPARGPAAPPRR